MTERPEGRPASVSYRHRRTLGVHELGDERPGGPLPEVVEGAFLDDTAVAHEDDPVGQVGGLAHVVGDEKDGQAFPPRRPA